MSCEHMHLTRRKEQEGKGELDGVGVYGHVCACMYIRTYVCVTCAVLVRWLLTLSIPMSATPL